MRNPWRWVVPLVLILAVAAVVIVAARSRAKAGSAADAHPTTEPAKEEKKAEPGHITLKPEEVAHAGLASEPVDAGTLVPEVRLYGVIQEDPGASFTVRAPAPGTVEAADGKPWPRLGDVLDDKAVIGTLLPRTMPSDQITIASQRVTLETQMAAARMELNTATASLAAAKTTYDRLKALNAQDKNVSDRAVEEAALKVKTEEAHLEGAKQTLGLATAALPAAMQLAPMPMAAAVGGQVVEVTAHPGESVESGQAVLRVARLDRVVAAVDLPAGEDAPAEGKDARIVPFGADGAPLAATPMGTAAATDLKTKSRVLLFRVTPDPARPAPRPGTPVTAFLPAAGEPLKGVTIPRAAVVRYLGKAWVYVAGDANSFERREVSLDHPAAREDGWFVLENVKDGDKVVTVGPQVLLSHEINAAFGGGD